MIKYILNLILIFIVSINMSGQTLKPKVAFDYFPNKFGYAFKINNQIAELGQFRTRIGLDFIGNIPINKPFIKDIKYNIYADIHSHVDHARNIFFQPRVVNFYNGISLSYKNIKLTYQHLCVHPTKTDKHISLDVYGGYDMISISYGY